MTSSHRRFALRVFKPWGKLCAFPLADCEDLDIACRKSGSALGQGLQIEWYLLAVLANVAERLFPANR
jgi:hypothetical protein